MRVKRTVHSSRVFGIANVTIIFSVFAFFLAGASVFYVYRRLVSDTPVYVPAGAREADENLYSETRSTPSPAGNTVTTKPSITPIQEKITPTPTSTSTVKTETGVVGGWEYTGKRDVLVSITPKSDKLVLYIDFERETFSTVNNISYDLSYDTDEGEKGVTGSFDPNATILEGYKSSGNPYIRQEVTLGTCSLGVCTYHSNPNNFVLVVATTRSGSTTIYTQTLTHQAAL